MLWQFRRRTGLVRQHGFCATNCRFCESGRPLQVWSGRAGSPPAVQLVQNSRGYPEMTRLGGFPGRGQSFVQGPPLLVGEVITFVICNQIDNRPLGQGCRLVENELPLLDTCSERAHIATLGFCRARQAVGRGRRDGWLRWLVRLLILLSASPQGGVLPMHLTSQRLDSPVSTDVVFGGYSETARSVFRCVVRISLPTGWHWGCSTLHAEPEACLKQRFRLRPNRREGQSGRHPGRRRHSE